MTFGRIDRAKLLKIGAAGVIATELRLNSPSVTITSPAAGSTVSGTIPVTATYGGPGFRLANLSVDGTQVASVSTQPIAFSLDTSRYPDGTHTLGVQVEYRKANQYHWTEASLQLGIRGTPIISAPGGWYPSPPSSYKATGTFAQFVQVDTAAGTTPDFALFHTQRQHVVQNGGGIFFVYNYTDSNHASAHWRLKRSTDNGATWATVYTESTFLNGGGAPAIETDTNGNVYVVVSQYNDATQNYYKIFRFGPGDGYVTPTIWSFSGFGAANKWGCNFDQTRNWIWIKAWQRSTLGEFDLLAVDLAGNVQVQLQIFKPWSQTSSYAHADAAYPFVEILHDGTLVVAWNNDAGDGIKIAPHSYYDDRLIYSTDAGTTWYGSAGSIASTAIVEADDTGTAANRGYGIVDLTAGVEFISATDTNYYPNGTAQYNFNAIGNIAFNNSAVHFWYIGDSATGVVGGAHRSYARFNWNAKAVDLRHSPFQVSDGANYNALTGTFCQDTTQASRLYFVGIGQGADFGNLVVTKTDDAGQNWDRYATQTVSNLPNYPTCSRFVQTDGSIIGGVVQAGAPNNIYFFRITPT